MACATFLLTTSFVFSTPGITQVSPSGFPIISTLLEQFLLKDVALLAASPLRCFSHLCRRGLRLREGSMACAIKKGVKL